MSRFSKATVLGHIEQLLDSRCRDYEKEAGKKFNWRSGYAQVPEGNKLAAIHYGEARCLANLHATIKGGELEPLPTERTTP